MLAILLLAFSPIGVSVQSVLAKKAGLKRYALVMDTIRFVYMKPENYRPSEYFDPLADQFVMSLDYLNQKIQKDPSDYKALSNRANLYFILDRFDEAIADYQSALEQREKHDEFVCGCIFSEKTVNQ